LKMSRARRWCAVAILASLLGGCAGSPEATSEPFTVDRALISVGYAVVIVVGVIGAHFLLETAEHNR